MTEAVHIPLFLRDLSYLVGQECLHNGKPTGWVLVSAPRYDLASGKWRAMANIDDSLCLVELTLRDMAA